LLKQGVTLLQAIVTDFRSRPAFHAIAANSAWLFIDRFARMGLALFIGVWVARYLGPKRYGELSLVFAYLALFQSIVSLGLDGIVVRDLAVNPSKTGEILGSTFALRVTAGAFTLVVAVTCLAISFGLGSQEVLLCACAGGLLLFQAFDTIDLWFQSRSQSKRTIIPKFTGYAFIMAIKVALIFSAAPLYLFATVQTVEVLIGAAGLCLSLRIYPPSSPLKFCFARARKLICESYPYILSALSITVYMRIDQMMIAHFLGYEASGIYAAAIPLSTVWYAIPTTLYVTLAPFIARKKQQSEQAYYDALLLIFRIFGAIALSVSVSTALIAPVLINILYGQKYQGASQILAIHVFGNLFVFQGMAQQLWLINERAARLTLWRTLSGGLVSVISNIVLLPLIGLPGAAISAVLSYGVSAVFSNLVLKPDLFAMQFGFSAKKKKKTGCLR
jgi:O-antigen/teichoic acid export membrane protein